MPVVTLSCTRTWGYEHYFWGNYEQGPSKITNSQYLQMGTQSTDDNGDYFQYPLFDFDWSQIPNGATINSAKLQIFPDYAGSWGSGTWYLQIMRVTAGWPEVNQGRAHTTDANMIQGYYGDYIRNGQWSNIDVTYLTRDMLTYGKYGFMFYTLSGYEIYTVARFWSAGSGEKSPKLVVDYNPPNQRPNPPILHNPGHGTITNNGNPYFSWSFSDNDAGDYQSAWQMQISAGDGGAFTNIVGDTGQVPNGDQSWTWYANLADNQYFWRMRTWDRYGAVSDWSWVPWFGVERERPKYTGTEVGQYWQNVAAGTTRRVWVIGVTDNWSGAYRSDSYYQTPDGNWQTYGMGQSGNDWYMDVPISAEGTYTVDMYIKDHAGNECADYPVRFKFGIDRSVPNIGSVSTQQYNKNANTTTRIYAYNVTDAISGVSHVSVWLTQPDGGAYQIQNATYDANKNGWYVDVTWNGHQQGNWGVDFRAHDHAGNTSVMSRAGVFVDSTAPTVSIIGNDYVGKQTSISIAWNYSDATPQYKYFIELINEAYTAPLWSSGWIESSSARNYQLPELDANFTCFVRMQVMDMAGNISGPIEATNHKITIDNTAPKIGRVTGNNQVDNPQYTNIPSGTFRIWAINVTDERSGINRVQFTTCNVTQSGGTTWIWYDGVRDGNTSNWYCDIKLEDFRNAEGMYYTDVYAYDNAGNESEHPRITTYVDRTPPSVVSVQGYSYTNQTTGTKRVWIYGVGDDNSGVLRVDTQYRKPGDNTVYSGGNAGRSGDDFYIDVPLSVDGEYTIIFYPYDKAGNVKTGGYETSFFVDSQRANDPKPSVVWGTSAGTFTWFPFSDPTPSSGLDRTVLHVDRWNGSEWVFDVDINNDGTPDLWYILPDRNQLEHTVTTLIPGTRYRYTVKHFDQAQNESAYTYYEFVTKRKLGEISLSGTASSLPIYDMNSGVLGSKELRIAGPFGTGCFELVATSDASASALRVATSQGIKAVSK